MYQVPNFIQTVSMRLSEVLADLGVNKRIVRKRRRAMLLRESMENVDFQLWRQNTCLFYYFGSRSEGTTTEGIKSDIDLLVCYHLIPVIQDLCEWIRGIPNFMMIGDNSVSPGYCFLQLVRYDAPLPDDGRPISYQHMFKDSKGRNLVKYSALSAMFLDRYELHGPARVNKHTPGFESKDIVSALRCKTWPQLARPWLDQQDKGQWPSAEMKQYCSRTGCFVVPVGCRGSEHEQLEWRISTSFAERCLMFDLNITQIRCYVLMKLIIKSFIDPKYEDVISSYMCKTVLFHCIANSHFNIWREKNLLSCLLLCLDRLYNNVINENCPHFIIPENNLMRGKILPAIKPHILKILKNIINSQGMALLGIKCDELGSRLHHKLFYLCRPFKTCKGISGSLLYATAGSIKHSVLFNIVTLKNKSPDEAVQILKNCISKIVNDQYEGLFQTACHLLAPWYYSTLGSVLASININQHNSVSEEALKFISLGLNTDVASSKLKLASIFYRVQDIKKTELILSEIERNYDLQFVVPSCGCYDFTKHKQLREEFFTKCDNENEDVIKYAIASCVTFLPCEIHCVPTELRCEMVRSTSKERRHRTTDDGWMDCAAIDSLLYLYFLQYKVNNHLGKNNEKQSALSKFLKTIISEPNLGHRDTALNILGKCMEQEDRLREALQCYLISFNMRRRNNAAKIHICRLVCIMINTRA